ncbi:MAG: RDD family protein [Myxococcales bacterium]|nr:RDD family protein [Myxococcales bacterium]
MSSTTSRSGLRVVRDEEGSPYPKASLLLRGGARLVDVVIAWTLYKSTGPAGVVIALLYLLFADGMIQGQSPGKKLFGVKVVYLPNRQGARNRDSVLRNAPFGLTIILSMMPELGFKAFIAGVVVIGVIETVKCWRDPDGLRLGDLWAQTQVVDGKVVTGQPQTSPLAEPSRAPARLKTTTEKSDSSTT